MGFWSTVGKAAVSVAKSAAESNKEADNLVSSWVNESDSFLIRKFKNGSYTEKTAATKVLRQRYPDENDRKEALRRAL